MQYLSQISLQQQKQFATLSGKKDQIAVFIIGYDHNGAFADSNAKEFANYHADTEIIGDGSENSTTEKEIRNRLDALSREYRDVLIIVKCHGEINPPNKIKNSQDELIGYTDNDTNLTLSKNGAPFGMSTLFEYTKMFEGLKQILGEPCFGGFCKSGVHKNLPPETIYASTSPAIDTGTKTYSFNFDPKNPEHLDLAKSDYINIYDVLSLIYSGKKDSIFIYPEITSSGNGTFSTRELVKNLKNSHPKENAEELLARLFNGELPETPNVTIEEAARYDKFYADVARGNLNEVKSFLENSNNYDQSFADSSNTSNQDLFPTLNCLLQFNQNQELRAYLKSKGLLDINPKFIAEELSHHNDVYERKNLLKFYLGDSLTNFGTVVDLTNSIYLENYQQETIEAYEEVKKRPLSEVELHELPKYLDSDGLRYIFDKYKNETQGLYNAHEFHHQEYVDTKTTTLTHNLLRHISNEKASPGLNDEKIRSMLVRFRTNWDPNETIEFKYSNGVTSNETLLSCLLEKNYLRSASYLITEGVVPKGKELDLLLQQNWDTKENIVYLNFVLSSGNVTLTRDNAQALTKYNNFDSLGLQAMDLLLIAAKNSNLAEETLKITERRNKLVEEKISEIEKNKTLLLNKNISATERTDAIDAIIEGSVIIASLHDSKDGNSISKDELDTILSPLKTNRISYKIIDNDGTKDDYIKIDHQGTDVLPSKIKAKFGEGIGK